MRLTTMTTIAAMALLVGCGGDGGGGDDNLDDGGESLDDTADDSDSAPDPDASAGPTTVEPETTDTSGETVGTDTTGTESTGTETGTEESGTTGEPVAEEYGALIVGTLFTEDMEEAQALHDALAAAGEKGAMMLGDFAHDALLGTTLLGTTENEFLAIDRWTSLEGANTLYGDPMFAKAFGSLFLRPTAPQMFQARPDWYGWGDLDVADDDDERYFIVVRGTLAAEDLDEAKMAHDGLAMAGEAAAGALGDVAHVVWLGVDDPHEFFAVDVWTDSAAIEAFYTDPAFVAGFSALFSGTPSVTVYASTDWYQW